LFLSLRSNFWVKQRRSRRHTWQGSARLGEVARVAGGACTGEQVQQATAHACCSAAAAGGARACGTQQQAQLCWWAKRVRSPGKRRRPTPGPSARAGQAQLRGARVELGVSKQRWPAMVLSAAAAATRPADQMHERKAQ